MAGKPHIASERDEYEPQQEQEQDELNKKFGQMNIAIGQKPEQILNQIKIKVNWHTCRHRLSDSSYLDLKDLSLLLDTAKPGDVRKGIIDLMRKILKEEHVVRVWLACHGGLSPAMGFIQYISCSRCATVSQFVGWLEKDSDAQQFLKDIIAKEKGAGKKVMNDMDYQSLEKLASYLSEQMQPKNHSLQFTWKDVACNAGIDRNTIEALNSPRHQAMEGSSMTEQMVNLLGGLDPNFKIAKLAYALSEIERYDVIRNCDIFKSCKRKKCVIMQDEEDDIEKITSLC